MTNEPLVEVEALDAEEFSHPAWDEPIICRVEVDLQGWLKQLTGDKRWEVQSEDETDTCISYVLRHPVKEAEVILYHNGYATVDVDGESVFNGALTTSTSDCAHLSYFHADGEEILLN